MRISAPLYSKEVIVFALVTKVNIEITHKICQQ